MSRFFLDARVTTPHFPGIGSYTRNLHAALLPLLAADESLTAITTPDASLLVDGQTIETSASNFSLVQQRTIPRLLSQHNATLYHSPYYLMPFRPNVPTVLTVYDLIGFHYPEYLSARAKLLFRPSHRLAIRAADAIVVISEATKRDLIRYFNPQAPIHVTPLAAAPHFRPTDATTVRAKFNLPDQYLLYFGSNKPHKNIVTLIEAVANLPDAPPLVIAGSWLGAHPEPKQMAERLALGDRVRFLGRIESADIAALYSGATLFVFPSLYEGFGLPVIEAMACGTPVACGKVWSLPEVGGEAVAYFDPVSAESITQTIQSLLNDEPRRQTLAALGLKQAAQ
ncbi:MAG: glycosyltransferase family 4 protein, partial [Candidatus Promineifilaceae bacterium]